MFLEVNPSVGSGDLPSIDHLRLFHPLVALTQSDQLPVAFRVAEFRKSLETLQKAAGLRAAWTARRQSSRLVLLDFQIRYAFGRLLGGTVRFRFVLPFLLPFRVAFLRLGLLAPLYLRVVFLSFVICLLGLHACACNIAHNKIDQRNFVSRPDIRAKKT